MTSVLQLLRDQGIHTYWDCRKFFKQEPYYINCRYYGNPSTPHQWKYPIFRLHLTAASDVNNPVVRECRGLILRVLDMETCTIDFSSVAAYGLPKTIDLPVNVEPPTFDYEKVDIYEMIDGTFIKLYNVGKVWIPATHRTMDANWRGAMWHGPKTFGEMWREAARHLDYSKLDPACTYWFILQHPENRIVKNYTHPNIVHIGTWLNTDTTQAVAAPVLQRNGNPYQTAQRLPLKSWNEVLSFVETLAVDVPGVTINDGATWYTVSNPRYMELHALKGNYQNMTFQYLSLRKNSQAIGKFTQTYPEYVYLRDFVEQRIQDTANVLLREYHDLVKNPAHSSSSAIIANHVCGLIGKFLADSNIDINDMQEYLNGLDADVLGELIQVYPDLYNC